ncbi:hypothetical protein YYC_03327 [Plasmodium yoelii 17X]|uniref:Uncharacterized protein n=1 Tax=Plasmodium yoelii 17X TaxID=1323249 RepID=V7PJ53_PLAYE|nr:hypothetical protein YYC_03327 [Plasmodium yoelii 17X]
MTNFMCQKFDDFRKIFRDELDGSGNYNFQNGPLKNYCPKKKCNNDIDKVNAGCLWLLYDFFGKIGASVNDKYKDYLVYIMIWLSYKLNQKTENEITKLNDFYSNHIKDNTEYTNRKINDDTYGSYKDIIDNIKEYMDIDIIHMSKFYELLKLLCKMNTAYKNNKSGDFSEHANNFFNKYKELFNDDKNTKDSSYSKVLIVVSNDYNNIDKNRAFNYTKMERPSLPTEKTPKSVEAGGSKEIKKGDSSIETGQSDTVTIILSPNTTLSASSLVDKLIPISFILVVTIILLGIAYKFLNILY